MLVTRGLMTSDALDLLSCIIWLSLLLGRIHSSNVMGGRWPGRLLHRHLLSFYGQKFLGVDERGRLNLRIASV